MKIQGNVKLEFDIDPKELGRVLIGMALKEIDFDDPGCDYFTSSKGYISTSDSIGESIGLHKRAAALINAGNWLIYGHPMEIEDYDSPPC